MEGGVIETRAVTRPRGSSPVWHLAGTLRSGGGGDRTHAAITQPPVSNRVPFHSVTPPCCGRQRSRTPRCHTPPAFEASRPSHRAVPSIVLTSSTLQLSEILWCRRWGSNPHGLIRPNALSTHPVYQFQHCGVGAQDGARTRYVGDTIQPPYHRAALAQCPGWGSNPQILPGLSGTALPACPPGPQQRDDPSFRTGQRLDARGRGRPAWAIPGLDCCDSSGPWSTPVPS